MAVIKYQRGSVTTVLSTELNSMAVGNRVLSAAIDNTTDLYLFEDLVLSVDFVGTPDAGAIVSVFLIEALDDTNYVEGSASIEPAQSDMVGSFNIFAYNEVTMTSKQILSRLGMVSILTLLLQSYVAVTLAQDSDNRWHSDLKKAAEISAKTNKPIFLVFRCVR
ncbi:MAG: hypothetical protein IID46_05435 [Planctomycetes bacterium]|nr:hypothetical protein [Planctomycetota bacterium]